MSDVKVLFRKMLENQAALNSAAYSETWLEKGASGEWNYSLAASQEIAEFINSYWLPWWSKAERDMANCRIELVDALHFMMSDLLIEMDGDIEKAVDVMFTDYEESVELVYAGVLEFDEPTTDTTLVCAQSLQGALNAFPMSAMISFFVLCGTIKFSVNQLYALYMGKSELNKFRQDHGYKQGKYKKLWDGKHEDNHFLSIWIAEQEVTPTPSMIRAFLETEYAKY